MSPTAQILRSELADANVFVVRLVGPFSAADSGEHAERLAARMRDEQRRGLIMDYRRCHLQHTVVEFAKAADVLSAGFPKGLRVAYVYGPAKLAHAALMTKRLAQAGVAARAFASFEEAEAFVRAED